MSRYCSTGSRSSNGRSAHGTITPCWRPHHIDAAVTRKASRNRDDALEPLLILRSFRRLDLVLNDRGHHVWARKAEQILGNELGR